MKNILDTIKNSAVGKATTKAVLIGGIASQLLTSCNDHEDSAKKNDEILNKLKAPVIVTEANHDINMFIDDYNVKVRDGDGKVVTLENQDKSLKNAVKGDTLK